MNLSELKKGQRVKPLDWLEVSPTDATLELFHGKGGEPYFQMDASEGCQFRVGGALGWHRAVVGSQSHEFLVEAKTGVSDGRGRFRDLLAMLHFTMISEFGETHSCLWNGKIYHYFICWLRDHVHVLKGMKYFNGELKTAIELYRDSQREDGMIFDNCYPRGPDENYWIVRFSDCGFYRPFEDKTFEFKRIPVENDVEYLFVEGVYYTWKATGDDAWMGSCLEACKRALEYSVCDEYRWSEKFGLLKRGYTIDTWDFQNEFDRNVEGDIMRVRPGTTRFGIMFGDNTGYIAACRQLAEMLEGVGSDAKVYLDRADELEQRLEKVSWLGSHYRHHVREEPAEIDLGVDESTQISLSNAYSLNRGIGRDKSRAIIQSYRGIKQNLPPGSPGEWYTIYPPFGRGFGGHSDKWQYMNASVTPIVAGELAHGAFQNGFEGYGADILTRLIDLGHRHGNKFHCSYTGAHMPPPVRQFRTMNLRPLFNSDVRGPGDTDTPGWDNSPNDLRELPSGDQTFCDVPFSLSAETRNAITLSERPEHAQTVIVPVGEKAASIYFFHTVSGGSGPTGSVTIKYEDGSSYRHLVLRGRDVTGWWMPDALDLKGHRTMDIGWKGKNDVLPYVAVSVWGLNNPHPDQVIKEILLEHAPEAAQWHVMGMTLCDHEAWFPTNPISFGIPNGWGAAAVVYALVEGLAGVVDTGTAFEKSEISLRWPSADEPQANVCVHYPASGGYVAYEYLRQEDVLTLTLTGSGNLARLRFLLPDGWRGGDVFVHGTAVPSELEEIEDSTYVCFDADLAGVLDVEVRRR